jgi:hypothetical protein
MLHRLVAFHCLGIALDEDVDVHHLNGIGHDNRPENLALRSRSQHLREHHGPPHPVTACLHCGRWFAPWRWGWPDKKPWKFCSRRCGGLYASALNRRRRAAITAGA